MKILFLLLPLYIFAYEFTIASYNIYNLFDDRVDGSEYSEFRAPKWGTKEFMQRVENISKVLRDLDSSIVALQEVENINALLTLKNTLKVYPYHAIGEDRDSPISSALLSKYKILSSKTLKVDDSKRGILKAILEIEGVELVVYVNHWTSLNSKESRRVSWAKSLMEDIKKESREYVIVGDLNSNYNRYLFHRGATAINETLKTIEDGVFVKKEHLKDGYHYNLWLELEKKDRYSYIYKGRKNTLDHIILPSSMFDGKGVEYKDGSFRRFISPYLCSKSIHHKESGFECKEIDRRFSDHLPIVATLSTKPYKKIDSIKPKEIKIEEIYNKKEIETPIILRDVVVIYRDDFGVIIKSAPKSRAIFIYAPEIELEVGERFDLVAHKIGEYQGAVQLEYLEIEKKIKKERDIKEYRVIADRDDDLKNSSFLYEVIDHIEGVYRDGELHFGERSVNIYFQDKSKRVKDESKIVIKSAKITKYRGKNQIVVGKNTLVKRIK